MSRGVRAERRRRALRGLVTVVGFTAGAVVIGYAALWGAARLFIEHREPAPFFARDRLDERPLVVAHQGTGTLLPENTLAAFRFADEAGADVLDTDLHRTADGALVLIHDDTVERVSDGTGAVADMTLAQLEELDFGFWFTDSTGGDPGRAGGDPVDYPQRGRGHRIITVEEFFRTFADGRRFGIEIKDTAPEAATELCELIRSFDYEERVLVSSFGQGAMDRFRSACPLVATSATESEVRVFYYLHRVGLNGLVEPDYEVLQVPELSGDRLVVSQEFVDDAAEWGLPVIPWTIDDPVAMDRLIDLGVAGINTNRTDLLVETLG